MTRVRIDEEADIQEPILSRRKSCLRSGCFSSCGCLLMVALLAILIIRISWGPKTLNYSHVPEGFPKDIPLFSEENVERVTLTRASGVNRTFATVLALPKLIVLPTLAMIDTRLKPDVDVLDYLRAGQKEISAILSSPGGKDAKNTFTLRWSNLAEDIDTIRAFYATELHRAGFGLDIVFDNRNNFEAKVIQDEVDGLITIENYDLRQEGVEYVTLKITVPHDR